MIFCSIRTPRAHLQNLDMRSEISKITIGRKLNLNKVTSDTAKFSHSRRWSRNANRWVNWFITHSKLKDTKKKQNRRKQLIISALTVVLSVCTIRIWLSVFFHVSVNARAHSRKKHIFIVKFLPHKCVHCFTPETHLKLIYIKI